MSLVLGLSFYPLEQAPNMVIRREVTTVTSQVFSPRYFVELTSTGPPPVAPSVATPAHSRCLMLQRQGQVRCENPITFVAAKQKRPYQSLF